MRLLLATPKRCFRTGGAVYTTGGSPLEFDALAAAFQLHVAADVREVGDVAGAATRVDPAVRWTSLGAIRQRVAWPPPLLAIRRAKRRVRALLARERPDVAVLKGPDAVTLALLPVLTRAGVPTLYHYSLDWLADADVSATGSRLRRTAAPYFRLVRRYRERLLGRLLPQADGVGTPSRPYAQELATRFGVSPVILPNSFSTQEADLAIPDDGDLGERGRFLYVGRVDRNKNLDVLIDALALLQTRLPDDREVALEIAGDGEALPGVLARAEELGVRASVRPLGYVKNADLRPLYERACALVLPSRSEVLGQVIIEAMSAGTPVIGAAVGGIPDLVEDGQNGFLFDPTSSEALAGAMECFVLDAVDRRPMRRAAIDTARAYTREATVERWRAALESLRDG